MATKSRTTELSRTAESEDDFFTEMWVTRFLGIGRRTLQNWRSDETGPRCIVKGTIARYPKKEFWEWYMSDDKANKKRHAG